MPKRVLEERHMSALEDLIVTDSDRHLAILQCPKCGKVFEASTWSKQYRRKLRTRVAVHLTFSECDKQINGRSTNHETL